MKYPFQRLLFLKRTVVFFLMVLFSSASLYSQGDSAKGKKLFNANCAACHKLNKKMTGPPLAGVVDKHDKDWLYKWIRNSSKLIKAGDAAAVKIFEEYNKVPMTAFPQLSDKDIDDILAYTSAPPPAPVAQSGSGSQAETHVSEDGGNNLYKVALIVVLVAFVLTLIAFNNKLRHVAEKSGLKVVSNYPEKSLWVAFKSNKFLVIISVVSGFLTVIYFVYGYLMQVGVDQGYQPVQPIHFSHKIHAGDNKIDCKYCHSGARVSKTSGVPSLNVCMNCHKNISDYNGEVNLAEGHDKAFYDQQIAKLYKAVGWNPDENRYTGKSSPVKWVRIHNLPDFVYFNHSQHVTVAGVECQKCHGPVEEMEVLYQHAPLTMGWCVNCHRETNVKMAGNAYYEKIHEQLSKKYGVEKLTAAQMGATECGKCHY